MSTDPGKSFFAKKLKDFVDDSLTVFLRRLPAWTDAPVMDTIQSIPWIRVRHPVNASTLPVAFLKKFVKAKEIPQRDICILSDVFVSHEGVVFKNGRIFIPSLPWQNDYPTYTTAALLLSQWRASPSKPFLDKPAVLVHDQWSTCNYYHWMIESLPRLLLACEMYPSLVLILPGDTMAYIKETIALLGISDVVYIPPNQSLRVSRLVFPKLIYYNEVENEENPPPGSPDPDTELIVLVRNRLISQLPAVNPPSRRVYVSRRRSGSRRLVNETAIQAVLDNFGFEIVFFEDLTFRQQVSLMRETAVLAGVHGANMVNLLFLQPGACVVELMNEMHVNDAYYLLASSLQIPYFPVPCRPLNFSESDSDVLKNNADLTVDPAIFSETLSSAVEYSSTQVLA